MIIFFLPPFALFLFPSQFLVLQCLQLYTSLCLTSLYHKKKHFTLLTIKLHTYTFASIYTIVYVSYVCVCDTYRICGSTVVQAHSVCINACARYLSITFLVLNIQTKTSESSLCNLLNIMDENLCMHPSTNREEEFLNKNWTILFFLLFGFSYLCSSSLSMTSITIWIMPWQLNLPLCFCSLLMCFLICLFGRFLARGTTLASPIFPTI